jgi:transcriptional regulator with XRE-family HTH domain
MKQLLQHIKSEHKTQLKAARIYGVSPSWLNKILKGKGKPPESMLNKLRSEGFDTVLLAPVYGVNLPEKIETVNEYVEIIRSYQHMLEYYEKLRQAKENAISALNMTIKELRANNLLLFRENIALKNFHSRKIEEIACYVKKYIDDEALRILKEKTR